MTTPTNPFSQPVPAVPEPTPLAATPLPLDARTPDPSTIPAPVLPDEYVKLTKADISAMLAEAVKAGAAQQNAANALGAPAVNAEEPEIWSMNHLLYRLISKAGWHNEREWRSAYATVDHHVPVPDETDGV